MASLLYICRITECEQRFYSARALIGHMSLSHIDTDSGHFLCNLDGCTNAYHNVSAYRKHVSRVHSEHWNVLNHNHNDESHCPGELVSSACQDINDDHGYLGGEDDDGNFEPHITVSSFQHEIAQSIVHTKLRTREMHMLPKSVENSIFEDIHCLMDTYQFGMQEIVRNRLISMGIDYQTDSELAQVLQQDSLFELASAPVKSDHLFRKFCRTNMNLIEPIPVFIDGQTGSGRTGIIAGHYVPIFENITNYLQHDDVWSSFQAQCEQVNSSSRLYDYTDGLIWHNSGLPNNHVRLHLYSDEFEVCNPLGSRKGVHKVCAFYYTIGNIDVKHRSALRHIHLAMLLKYKLVRKHGYDKLIKPLIDDLKALESVGITINVDGKLVTLKGSLVTLSGDNLSCHAIGGFNPSFSSGRICRHCLTPYSGICDVKSEEDCILRTPECHKYHVDSILADNSLRSVYGVYDSCPLSVLTFFNPVQCLPPDVMHDILEGTMSFSVSMVVKRLIRQHLFSMSKVCETMQSFVYGSVDLADKPQPLSEDFVRKNKSIAGKAVEKWCLFRMLPLYIAHLIPEKNKEWQVYLTFRRICDIVLAPVINPDDLGLLEILIAHHHEQLVDLGSTYFPPKLHYLVHYSRLILHFGPLRHLWSMRFEANHQYFKQLARRIRNFKNITGSLAERYQMKQCCERSGQNCLGVSVNCLESQKQLPVAKLPTPLQTCLSEKFGIAKDAHVNSIKWLMIDGRKFFVTGMVVIDVPEDGLPIFLHIQYIVSHLGLWILCGTVAVSAQFLSHYHAFKVQLSREWIGILPTEILDIHPVVNMYKVNGDDVVVLRHHI